MKGKKKRIFVRALLALLLAPLWLPVLLVVLLYLPPVQRVAVAWACEYASEQTGLTVTCEALRLTPLLDVDLQGLTARERHDTLLDVRHCVVDLTLGGLFRGEIDVETLDLTEGQVDTKDFLAALRLKGRIGQCRIAASANLDPLRAHINTVYLDRSDVFIALRDTTLIDTTTSSPLPLRLTLDDVRLRETHVAFHSRRDTLSLDAQVGMARATTTSIDLSTSRYQVGTLQVDSTRARLLMPYDGMDMTLAVGQMATQRADLDVAQNLYTLPALTLRRCEIDGRMSGIGLQAQARALQLDALRADVEHNTYDLDALTLDTTQCALTGPSPMKARLTSAHVETLRANLTSGAYSVARLALDAPSIDAAPLHITSAKARLADFNADLPRTLYRGSLQQLSLREAGGFRLTNLSCAFLYDGLRARLSHLSLTTPTSHARGHADIALHAPYPFEAYLEADLSRHDIMALAGPYIPDDIASHYPDLDITLGLDAHGTLHDAQIRRAYLSIPRILEATATHAYYTPARAGLHLDLSTHDLTLVRHLAALPENIDLPPMQFTGDLSAPPTLKGTIEALGRLTTRGGSATLDATLDTRTLAYRAQLALKQFPLRAFLTDLPLAPLTAEAHLEGRGTDPATADAHASLRTRSLKYSIYDLSGLGADLTLHHGTARAHAYCHSAILDADVNAKCKMQNAKYDVSAEANLRHIDARALGLVDYPLDATCEAHLQGGSDLRSTHWAEGTIDSLNLTLRDTTFQHNSLTFAATLLPDSAAARLQTGDLTLSAAARGTVEQIIDRSTRTADRLLAQLREYRLDASELRTTLPTVSAHIESGQENVIYRYLEGQGLAFRDLYLDLEANPETGLNAEGHVHDFQKDSVRIDDIALHIAQDTTGLAYDAHALAAAFRASIKGSIATDGTSGMINVVDGEGKTWFNIGLKGDIDSLSKRLTIIPHNPILAYRRFKVNADNYLYMGKAGRVRADIDLLADDGTGLKLYSTQEEDTTILQDLTLAINHFNVGELCSVIPGAPRAEGFLSGDVHMTATRNDELGMESLDLANDSTLSQNSKLKTQNSFMCDLTVADMAFEGTRMGDIGVNAIYLPNADGSQYVNGLLRRGELDIAEVEGTYYPNGELRVLNADLANDSTLSQNSKLKTQNSSIDVRARLLDLPASLADAFTGGLLSLAGTLGGELAVTGSLAEPHINGALTTHELHVLAPEYSVDFRLQDDTLRVEEAQLHLDRLEAYSTGPTPLVLDGDIDFRDFSHLRLALNAEAHNFRLLDAPRSRQAAAYGRAYVDLGARLTGGLDHIDVRARLDVLSGTDLSYVLKDSPLAATNELDELVTFAGFADTTATLSEAASPPLDLNLNVAIGINDAAQVHCYLSDDRTNYVNATGGGDLTMTYDPRNALQLSGRYTIHEGDIKYSMLVVPLKNFTITNGSYVEFLGPVADPHLNVAAKERLTTTITENQSPRSVAFDVGLSLTGTLEKMGLTFTIEAPEDMSIQNELAQMSDEQRGRVAVTMLATGMYINEASSQTSGGFSASNALNAFLQSQISNLSSKALGSVDLSVGMENGTTSTGSTTTDYSFRFAKRFWNNRISVIIGGKVSTGAEAENTGQTIINNVSLEYRLDNSATRYVKLFYDREAASLLEGEVTEMGAGIVLRRKTERLGELFMFRKK